MKRLAASFLVAPAIVLLLLATLCVLAFGFAKGGDAAFVLVVIGLPVAYTSCAVFGAPLFVLFRRHAWQAWWQVTLGGVGCAAPFSALLYAANPSAFGRASGAWLLVLCLLIGGAIALVFWLFTVQRSDA